MKLPIALFSLFAFAVCFTYDPALHDWPVVAYTLAVGALVTIFWTHRRENR